MKLSIKKFVCLMWLLGGLGIVYCLVFPDDSYLKEIINIDSLYKARVFYTADTLRTFLFVLVYYFLGVHVERTERAIIERKKKEVD